MKKNLLFIICIAFSFIKLSAQPFLYGFTHSAGTNGLGTLFKFNAADNTIEAKHPFDVSDGILPYGKMLHASNGKLYSTTSKGGTNEAGTIVEFDPATNTFTKNVEFDYTTTGGISYSSLTELGNGKLVGTCTSGGAYDNGTIFQYDIANNIITNLYDFNDPVSGTYPYHGLALASNGKLYGLTLIGGPGGYGTLFEFDLQTSSFTVLQSFDYSDGAYPLGLLREYNGKLYGAAQAGGTNDNGTIFEYDFANNIFITRVSFDYASTGAYPVIGFNQATNGLFYGTTVGGGQYESGTLFSFDPNSGSLSNLHDFNIYGDGLSYNPVMQASDENLYGMTNAALGDSGSVSQYGSIYKYNIGSNVYSTLLNFESDTVLTGAGAYPFWTEFTEVDETNNCAGFSVSISGSSTVLGTTTNTFTAPAGMDTYAWSVSGGSASIVGSTTASSVSVLSSCSAGSYTLTITITKNGCTSTCTKTVSVLGSTTITVYSSLYTTGQGNHPSVTKSALATSLKVFDRHIVGRRDSKQDHYATVWNGTTGLISSAIISGPVLVSYGGGPTYKYIITVPANGKYLVIGQSIVSSTKCGGSTCTIYTGRKSGAHDDVDGDDHDDEENLTACSNSKIKFHTVLKDYRGKCREAETNEQHGSLLLIATPIMLDFTDSIENLPIIYESVEGNWSVDVSPTVPDGFYAMPEGSLSTSVTDSVIDAVQFTIADTGSDWTFTQLKHQIKHKGADRIVYSYPTMVNNRTNKLSGINIMPNPANEFVKIVLPEFEGGATLSICNIYGQKVQRQKINIVGGTSVSMNISSLQAGVYVIVAENSSGRVTTKLIKK